MTAWFVRTFVASMLMVVGVGGLAVPLSGQAQLNAKQQQTTIRILVTTADDHLSHRGLMAAEEGVERLFRIAGIAIEWVDHVVPDLPMVVAIVPPGGAERIGVGLNAMGYTFRTEDPEPGGRALIFFDRVEKRAQIARVDTSRLLGAVIAHEIGHMLLPEAHSQTGLMRGVWNDRDLHLIDMGGLRFTAGEPDRIRRQLLLRAFTD